MTPVSFILGHDKANFLFVAQFNLDVCCSITKLSGWLGIEETSYGT